ncbi:hypothetical protein IWZ01DRAFT_485884 [Phyllosticta capitalensis]|uniref:Uncharacterized protein n=1 Tax=Phyllosticta capitalensis TaxID=121624 RepID=A0ABR1YJ75_9PEZI
MSSPELFADASSQELHSIIFRLLQQHRRNGDRLRNIAIRYHNTHPDARLDKSIPKDMRAEAFARFCPTRGTSQARPSDSELNNGRAVLEKARGMLRADAHSAANLRRARQLLRQGAVPLVNACAAVDKLDAATAMVEAVAAERWRHGLDRHVDAERLEVALGWAWKYAVATLPEAQAMLRLGSHWRQITVSLFYSRQVCGALSEYALARRFGRWDGSGRDGEVPALGRSVRGMRAG